MRTGSLVFIDLDYLKEINDCYGHENGDRYLVCFAENMKCAMDRAGSVCTGMQEMSSLFCLHWSRRADTGTAKRNSGKESRSILILTEKCRNISFSYGIVAFEEKEGKLADLVKEADQPDVSVQKPES